MIQFANVTKRFGSVTAVDALSFTLNRGETLALIGPNGSGKSTTLKLALGLVRPTRGAVTIAGQPICAEARRNVGYLPQRIAFAEGISVAQSVRFYAALRGARAAVDDRLDQVGLGGLGRRAVHTLSGGMKQRLGIAIALLGDPDTLVLDEPTAALDPTGALEVRELILDLKAQGQSVLLSSHDLAEVGVLADRVAVCEAGRIVALGTLSELRATYNARSTEDVYRAITRMPRLVA
jgi:ABC-type multidrug transport system ATPase subunit